jgi:transposase
MNYNPFYVSKQYQAIISYGYEKDKISPMCSAINYFVDQLDLDFLNMKSKSNKQTGGRPTFDRKNLLKLVLLGIHKRVTIRNIEKQFGVENEFSYLLEPYKVTPGRYTFSKFLKEIDPYISDIFRKFIKSIEKEYELDLANLYCDGTTFDAHNDRHKVVTDFNVQRSIIKWNKVIEDENSSEEKKLLAKQKLLLDDERLQKLEKLGRSSYGRTDSDCFLIQDKNKSYIAGYNAQLVEETKKGLIVYAHVSNKNPDSAVFEEMLDPILKVYQFKSITFDAGYGTVGILRKLNDLGIKAITTTRKDKDKEDTIYISDLLFNEDFSIGLCPHKKTFRLVKARYKDGNKRKYECPDCSGCKTNLNCKLRGTDGYLFVNLDEYSVVKEAKNELKSPFGKEQYRLRGNKCESPNGYIKGFLRAKKLTMNKIKRVKTMVYLYSFLYDLQRLITIKTKEESVT